ncbi:unnamed protein product [Arctia plantaginis]|uniref:Superoxide dismutase [Cu-Zn] n=1 Tax=Arctia plantaginis TaxID=874455 RepID=A0A8S1AUF8_ARCPL|nr:unnamed protein product [Arctia plantaginis]
MIKTLIFLASAAVIAVAGTDEVVNGAIALLSGTGVTGNVTFVDQADGKVRVTGRIVGLLAGEYGFHVHQKGDITGGCASTLSHFNPYGKQHGHPEDENRHVGDLGNIHFDETGTANINFVDSMIKLSGPSSIIGRGLVLHERNDDYGRSLHPDSKTTGNAGGRVACGVIGILDSRNNGNKAASAFILIATLAFSIVFPFML